ncbi:MAG: cellulose biosynthesis cyclic di-GMP-binding regulatory protein BcsB [Desulfobacterales bacterium]
MLVKKALSLIVLFTALFQAAALAATLQIPLRKLAPVQDYRLRGSMDSYSFSLPIPERWQVKKASLYFAYVNSSALIPLNSRLVFTVNNQPLAQIRLNPDTPQGEVVVPIPGSLFKAGYNPCSFWVSQHYTIEECEDPFSPELWTWLKLNDAYFSFEVEPVPVPARVSAVNDFLFDPRNIFDTRVHLVLPALRPDYLQAAALAAAGVGLRYEYRVPELTLADALRPGVDNILIALRQDLPAVWPEPMQLDDGPVIAVQPLPEKNAGPAGQVEWGRNPGNALVIVTGGDEAELLTAARAFAALSHPLPGSPATRISNLKLPEIQERMIQRGLLPGRAYSFASLGAATTEFRGMSAPRLNLDLRLASDLYFSPNKFASVVLHMAYDAMMRSDSVLNIRLNGKFFAGVRLDNPRGDYFRDYRVDIPLAAFKPGGNQLSFEAVLTPLHTDKCTLIQTENLRLTLFADSQLLLPDAPHWIKMPQIGVFFQDAFPMGRWPDMREAAVRLTETTYPAAGAALNLVALGAQKIGYPPFGLSWFLGAESPKTPKDIIVAGSLPTLPKELLGRAPIAGIAPLALSLPQLDRPSPRPSVPTRFWAQSGEAPDTPRNPSDLRAASTVQGDFTGNLGPGRAALMQFRHPEASDRTVLVLTADSAGDLLAGSRALWEPAVQAACDGDLVLVDLQRPEATANASMVGPSWYVGSPGRVPGVQNFINTHPVLSLAGLLALLLLLGLVIYKMVTHRRRRRLEQPHA